MYKLSEVEERLKRTQTDLELAIKHSENLEESLHKNHDYVLSIK